MARIFFKVFFIFIVTLAVIIMYDINVYKNGGRPYYSIVDGICGIFFTPKRNCVVKKCPLQDRCIKMIVSHQWRGNYQFRLWVPETKDGKSPIIERLGLVWKFSDEMGNEVFNQESPPSKYSPWDTQLVGVPCGYAKSFVMYTAPYDVPIDKELCAEIQVIGDVEKFLELYPNSHLLLIKERDK